MHLFPPTMLTVRIGEYVHLTLMDRDGNGNVTIPVACSLISVRLFDTKHAGTGFRPVAECTHQTEL